MTISTALRHLLTLQLIPGLGPMRIGTLLEHFGSPEQILQANEQELGAVAQIGTKLAHTIVETRIRVDVDAELAWAEREGVRLLQRDSPEYPEALSNIASAPYLLYIKGSLLARDQRAVALVGSRACTSYGQRLAQRLATGLARAEVTVVSGLARGIDGAAHRGALEAGGRTLAVLAGGLSSIYPREHTDLARSVEQAGALLTESKMEQESTAGLFPARNRIISGLCQAVVIVEAPEKSGALITATHAGEQGRTVLAVPGQVDASTSGGCHELIRKGAVLCRDVDDILEEIEGVSSRPFRGHSSTQASSSTTRLDPPAELSEPQRQVWEFLANGPRAPDEMVQHLRMGVSSLSSMLLMMEMKKVVRRLPGNRYERC